jgi:CcmD family protein
VSSGEKYLAAAYLVVFLAVLVYVAIIAAKLARLERDVGELAELARNRSAEATERREAAAAPAARPRSGPVEGVWGNREVPPAAEGPRRG